MLPLVSGGEFDQASYVVEVRATNDDCGGVVVLIYTYDGAIKKPLENELVLSDPRQMKMNLLWLTWAKIRADDA